MSDPLRRTIATRARSAAPDSPTPAPAPAPAAPRAYPRLTLGFSQWVRKDRGGGRFEHVQEWQFLQPVANDPEAVDLLAKHRGQSALDEALAYVAQLDDKLNELITHVTSSVITVPSFFEWFGPVAKLRAGHAARAEAIATALGVPAPAIPAVPEIDEVLSGHCHHHRGAIDSEVLRIRTELDQTEVQLAGTHPGQTEDYFRPNPPDISPRLPHDPLPVPTSPGADRYLNTVTPLFRRRRALKAQLALATNAAHQAATTTATLAKAAIEAAGGESAVVTGLCEAAAVAGRFGEGDPEGSEFAKLKDQISQAETAAQRLADAGATGLLSESARHTISEANGELDAIRGRIAQRQKDHFTDHLKQAGEGIEASREYLARIAASCPSAFKSNFAEAMTDASWETAKKQLFCKLLISSKGGKP